MHPYASCFAHHCAAASICTTVDWRIYLFPLYFSAFAKSCSPMLCCQAARRTTFFQGIGEHMNGPTILASSTMRPKWFSRGRICHSLRFSFCFSPSTQGQLPASCQILFVSPARLCFILRILTSHALTVVLLHTCLPKKNGTSGMVDTRPFALVPGGCHPFRSHPHRWSSRPPAALGRSVGGLLHLVWWSGWARLLLRQPLKRACATRHFS